MNKIRKGDTVIVTKGKDKGKTGKVLEVFPTRKRVTVEKVNMVKKHKKPSQKSQGGIIETVASISWSNVKLVCQKTNKPTRVQFVTIDGVKKRKAKASGEVID